ncbi:S16 family serine protease [Pseudomonas sp. PCH446]
MCRKARRRKTAPAPGDHGQCAAVPGAQPAAEKRVAMTGELTLTGHVLPIGGVREKVIAARRQKLFELILPEANRGHFEELPDYLKEGITVHFAKRFSDAAKILF